MSRTAVFRLLRRWFPLPGESLSGSRHFMPPRSRDWDPGEVGLLSVAAGVGYAALMLTLLEYFLPHWVAVILAVPVVFLLWQLLIFVVESVRSILARFGLFSSGHPQDFHVPCHLILLTILALLGLQTPYRIPALCWLVFFVLNLACAIIERVWRPPTRRSQ
ncbi:MAG: hypothetical protein KA004_03585 [Verrucomicrobiales bacterium]|nr:hypothetical protein [Verrucomicrobiales bacterium]